MNLGLADGLRLRSLSRDMGNAYDDTPGDGVFPFADSGAIDVLYAGGAGEKRFGELTLGSKMSDHAHDPAGMTTCW